MVMFMILALFVFLEIVEFGLRMVEVGVDNEDGKMASPDQPQGYCYPQM